jgi:hypothetical protein
MLCRPLLLTLALVLLTAGAARADLDSYLHSLNVSAEADLGDFRAQVGAHFGTSGSQLDLVFRTVGQPADAPVCLWLAQQSHQPVEVVLRDYRERKGQGWGALAQSLGIMPGSAAFKALKRGDLGWQPAGGNDKGKGESSGNGKMKGHSH